MQYNHIDLFSGIGGWGYAATIVFGEDYHNLVFVEIDSFGQHIIRKNFGEETNIQGDVHQFNATQYRGKVDILTASWPCQSFSVAGNRKGTDDDRYLWPEALRVLRECKPRWFIGENVGGFISLGLDQTLSDLEEEGYTAEAFVLPAVGVNAPHQRVRVWIVAHSNSNQHRSTQQGSVGEANSISSLNRKKYRSTRKLGRANKQSRNVAYSDSKGLEGGLFRGIGIEEEETSITGRIEGGTDTEFSISQFREWRSRWWSNKCGLGEHPNGISDRMDCAGWECGIPRVTETPQPYHQERLKALGNSIVPQIPMTLFWFIKRIDQEMNLC